MLTPSPMLTNEGTGTSSVPGSTSRPTFTPIARRYRFNKIVPLSIYSGAALLNLSESHQRKYSQPHSG